MFNKIPFYVSEQLIDILLDQFSEEILSDISKHTFQKQNNLTLSISKIFGISGGKQTTDTQEFLSQQSKLKKLLLILSQEKIRNKIPYYSDAEKHDTKPNIVLIGGKLSWRKKKIEDLWEGDLYQLIGAIDKETLIILKFDKPLFQPPINLHGHKAWVLTYWSPEFVLSDSKINSQCRVIAAFSI